MRCEPMSVEHPAATSVTVDGAGLPRRLPLRLELDDGGESADVQPLLLLLLTHDLKPDGHDLQLDGRDLQLDRADAGNALDFTQLSLPGIDPPIVRTPRRSRGPKAASANGPRVEDPLLSAYSVRLTARGAARKGQAEYRYQLACVLKSATRLGGQPISYAELLRDEMLLGQALVDDVAATTHAQLSRWTLAQRRSAIRSFAALMRPELLELLGEEPRTVVDRALRRVADRVGSGYRLSGGAARRRGGRAPSASQIRAVVDAVTAAPGYRGARNRAFFTILAEAGCRVNALRALDGSDCFLMPSGRLRVFLHEKGKAEPREVELSQAAADSLRAYADAFNHLAAVRQHGVRVRIGEQGPVWRNSERGSWPYKDILATLRRGCVAAEVAPFSPHAIRRAFATDAASVLPRHVVAHAGGWKGLERLDDHYVQARNTTIWEKLGRAVPSGDSPHVVKDAHAATRSV